MLRADVMPACTSDTTATGANDSATIRPLSALFHRRRRPMPLRIRRALEARKRQLYGRPYMRTDAINWFAFSELCRSLQDGGKTPLTLLVGSDPFFVNLREQIVALAAQHVIQRSPVVRWLGPMAS